MSENQIMTDEKNLDDLNGRYLSFYIDDTFYGIELFHVTEIISIQPITFVPSLPSYIKGIINLRGKVVPVIDVRLKFGQEERPYDDKTCIIVVLIEDMQVGLIVDSVAEVVSIHDGQSNTLPDLGRQGERYLSSISKIGDRSILNIDCNKFFQNDLQFY